MKPRLNLVERLSVAALIVLADPEAFGLPASLETPAGLSYGPLLVLLLCLAIDGRHLALALRAAADAVDDDRMK